MISAFLARPLSISAALLRAELSGRHIKGLTTGALRSRGKMVMTKQDDKDNEEEKFNATKVIQDFFF